MGLYLSRRELLAIVHANQIFDLCTILLEGVTLNLILWGKPEVFQCLSLTLWTRQKGAQEFITVSNMRNATFEWNICLLSKRRNVYSWQNTSPPPLRTHQHILAFFILMKPTGIWDSGVHHKRYSCKMTTYQSNCLTFTAKCCYIS